MHSFTLPVYKSVELQVAAQIHRPVIISQLWHSLLILVSGGYLSSLSWACAAMHKWLGEFCFHKLMKRGCCKRRDYLSVIFHLLSCSDHFLFFHFRFQVQRSVLSGFQPLHITAQVISYWNEEHLSSELKLTNSKFPFLRRLLWSLEVLYEIPVENLQIGGKCCLLLRLLWVLWSWRSWLHAF